MVARKFIGIAFMISGLIFLVLLGLPLILPTDAEATHAFINATQVLSSAPLAVSFALFLYFAGLTLWRSSSRTWWLSLTCAVINAILGLASFIPEIVHMKSLAIELASIVFMVLVLWWSAPNKSFNPDTSSAGAG